MRLSIAVGCLLAIPLHAQAPGVGRVMTPDSIRLWYRVVGSGSETVIVPMGSLVDVLLDTLASGRRLVLYDQRNRARSDAAPLDRVGLDWQVRDLETIREAVGADRVAIIGWSGTGLDVFVYALRHPDRVTRIVQLAPSPPRADPWSGPARYNYGARIDTAEATRLQTRYLARVFASDTAAACRASWRLYTAAMLADPRNIIRAPEVCFSRNEWPHVLWPYFEALAVSRDARDWRQELANVTVPRLVIAGQQDHFPVEGVSEWVAGQAHARLLLVPNAGHWPHAEQPALVLAAMEEFLSGRWPPAAVTFP